MNLQTVCQEKAEYRTVWIRAAPKQQEEILNHANDRLAETDHNEKRNRGVSTHGCVAKGNLPLLFCCGVVRKKSR